MTHDTHPHEDQMTRLMERAMLPVAASEELVAGSLTRGRRVVRRRRSAQAVGVGGVAALATVVAVAVASGPGDPDDRRPSVSTSSANDSPTTETPPTRQPADELPPHLERVQELLLDALPADRQTQFGFVSVDYDPDGRGVGEVRAVVASDSGVGAGQDARCDRVARSPAGDDCVDSGAGWVFTRASLPDVSGKHPDLAGVAATYILRDGATVNLVAYNAPEANLGTAPTRTDPVLDAAELVELATETDWFG